MTTRICLLVGQNGSLTPAEAVSASRGIAEPILLLDRAEAAAAPALPAIARGLAETRLVDATDPDSIADLVRAERAGALTTFVDAFCPVVDEVGARLFGRTVLPGRWRKDVQRELLVTAGVSAISGTVASTPAELAVAITRLGFPVVVKPVRGVASRDAWQLRDTEEQARFAATVGLDGSAAFVVEPYIDGVPGRDPHRADYLSAELFAGAGTITGFLTDRPPLAQPFRETGIVGPSTVDPVTELAVLAQARAAHRALGLGPGAFHIEVKLTGHGPEVLEVNGRLGGYVRRLVQLGTGSEIGPAALLAALDRPVEFGLDWHRQVAALFLQPPVQAVQVSAAPRRRDVQRLPGVRAVDQLSPAGTPYDWRAGTGPAAAKVWLTAASDPELAQLMAGCARWLADAFEFRDAAGRPVRDDDWLDRLSAAETVKGASR